MIEHWCKEHQKIWFKKGKMKGYAHPIVDEDGEPTGEWCNEPEQKEADEKSVKSDMTKNDWAEKDHITRKSIERQKALDIAAQLCSAGKIDIKELPKYTKSFEKYFEQGGDSKLVEEAKRLGAHEVEPGEIPY